MGTNAEELLASAFEALAAGDAVTAGERAGAILDLEERGGAHHLLGGLCYIDDRVADARRHWELAFRLLREEGLPCEAARVAIELARLHASTMGHPAAGSGWVERARRLLESVGPCVEWGYLELATLACDRFDVDALLDAADRALAIAVEFGDVDLETQALADSGLGLVSQGRGTEGFARLDAALAAISAGEVGFPAAGGCFCSMLTACDRAGDVRRAEEWTRIIAATGDAVGFAPIVLTTHCRMAYGSVLCTAGRWVEAEALLVEALGPADAPAVAHRALTAAHLAGLRVEQGRLDEAADLLAPFEDHVTACAPLARVHLRRGELDLANAVLRRGLRELTGDVLRAVPMLGALVEVEIARGDLVAARIASDDLTALARGADVDAVRATATVADGRVLAAVGDLDRATVALEAGLAGLGADERPLDVALVRLDLAAVRAASGHEAAAVAEARAARAGFERLGATSGRDRAAALLRSLGDSGGGRGQPAGDALVDLTAREREVLELVSQGLTNAQIGERLYISSKTVEHHVGRVLAKLGVRSRAEAAALAVRAGLTPVTGSGVE